jgi:tRNA(Arg) A34 adenosine deaminase TadA
MPEPADLEHLRRAITVSESARDHGNHPFGAVLVGPGGDVVLEAENTVTTDDDLTGHAEINLVRFASRAVAADDLLRHTLYSSCEPCAMCAGAIYWAGIGRVVYGLSEAALLELTGNHPRNTMLMHPCRLVFADGRRETEVAGPLIEAEAAAPHVGFWT